jgi:hypothetical protein
MRNAFLSFSPINWEAYIRCPKPVSSLILDPSHFFGQFSASRHIVYDDFAANWTVRQGDVRPSVSSGLCGKVSVSSMWHPLFMLHLHTEEKYSNVETFDPIIRTF